MIQMMLFQWDSAKLTDGTQHMMTRHGSARTWCFPYHCLSTELSGKKKNPVTLLPYLSPLRPWYFCVGFYCFLTVFRVPQNTRVEKIFSNMSTRWELSPRTKQIPTGSCLVKMLGVCCLVPLLWDGDGRIHLTYFVGRLHCTYFIQRDYGERTRCLWNSHPIFLTRLLRKRWLAHPTVSKLLPQKVTSHHLSATAIATKSGSD